MKIRRTIKLTTYSCELVFMVTDDIKLESNKIYKKYKLKNEDSESEENEGLLLNPDISKYFLIIDLKYLTHNTIAHEIYHAAARVTKHRGVIDEEAQAWLCGHLTAEVYKFLDKKKIKITHGR